MSKERSGGGWGETLHMIDDESALGFWVYHNTQYKCIIHSFKDRSDGTLATCIYVNAWTQQTWQVFISMRRLLWDKSLLWVTKSQ